MNGYFIEFYHDGRASKSDINKYMRLIKADDVKLADVWYIPDDFGEGSMDKTLITILSQDYDALREAVKKIDRMPKTSGDGGGRVKEPGTVGRDAPSYKLAGENMMTRKDRELIARELIKVARDLTFSACN
jgi:hypothetical protein